MRNGDIDASAADLDPGADGYDGTIHQPEALPGLSGAWYRLQLRFEAWLAKSAGAEGPSTAARIQQRLLRENPDPKRAVTEIRALPVTLREVEFATVQPERAFVRIAYDSDTNTYFYEAIEPILSPAEREALDWLKDTLVRTMHGRGAPATGDPKPYLLAAAGAALEDHDLVVDDVTRERLHYYLVRDFLGYGVIDVLMLDPFIEDVSCNGPRIPIYIFHRQYESVKTNIMFSADHELDLFVIRLAQRCGKQISIADPLLDATLPDTSRLQACLSREVTTRGSSFTIRRFRSDPLTPSDLIRVGSMDAGMAAFFWLVMEEGSSVIFAGGTASGKTTTLNAISVFIPPQKKIVSIEDTREINLPHENWVAGLTRAGSAGEMVGGKAAGTIDMYKLLETALRQRPEYLLVGEVRGAEAFTLFQAMATGHAAYSTMHADSVQSAVYRLENEPINIPRIMLQTLRAVGIQAQVRIGPRLGRRMKEIVEIVGIDPDTGDLITNTVFTWDPAKDRHVFFGKSVIFEEIAKKRNAPLDKVVAEWRNRTKILEWMVANGVRHINDVAALIAAYYHNPESVLVQTGIRPLEVPVAVNAIVPAGG